MPTFYIDSADRATVIRLLATGLFGGVTTNPAILDKAGLGSDDIPDLVTWATDAGARRVFVQSWGTSAHEIVDRGAAIRGLGAHVVIKVPASREGIEAAAALSPGGPVLVTALHAAHQVLPAIASGARFVAPFVGRMDAAGRDGVGAALDMQAAIRATAASTSVLAGSLRTPEQVLRLAQGGVQHMTLGPDVWDRFFDEELTAGAVARFAALTSTTSS